MRRITQQILKVWALSPMRQRKPRPFPGKDPTRVVFSIQNVDYPKWNFYYNGRKSAKIWTRFYERVNRPGMKKVFAMEYDTRGPVIVSLFGHLVEESLKMAVQLWEFYHPGIGWDKYFSWSRYPYEVDSKLHQYRKEGDNAVPRVKAGFPKAYPAQ